jgi:hypothetical protein
MRYCLTNEELAATTILQSFPSYFQKRKRKKLITALNLHRGNNEALRTNCTYRIIHAWEFTFQIGADESRTFGRYISGRGGGGGWCQKVELTLWGAIFFPQLRYQQFQVDELFIKV